MEKDKNKKINKRKHKFNKIFLTGLASCLIFSAFLINPVKIKATDSQYRIEVSDFRKEENSYMSVLDIYDIELFDDKTIEKEKKLKNNAEENTKELNESLFNEDIKYLISEEDFEKNLKEYDLFSKDIEQERKKYNPKKEETDWIFAAIIIIFLNLIAAQAAVTYNQRKKLRKRQEN